MAADKPTASEAEDEQSMEEILQSIRRIIAEEDKQAEENAGGTDDVLELTEIFEAPPMESAYVDSDLPQDPLAAIDALMSPPPPPAMEMAAPTPKAPEPVAAKPEPEPAPMPAPEPKAPAPQPPMASTLEKAIEPLISEQVAKATASSLKTIRETAQRANAPKAPLAFRSGTTVEDLMLEALRPMLRDWLDSNLPQVVERIVTREIHAIVEHADDF